MSFHTHALQNVRNFMSLIFDYSSYFVVVAFILTLFRQYKGYYFYFFLLLAISGPVSHIFYLLGINQNIIIFLTAHLLIYSLHPRFFNKKIDIGLLIIYIIFSFIVYLFINFPYNFMYFIFIHMIIINLITYRMLRFAQKYLEIRYFHLTLLLFEISVIGKYLSLIMNLNSGVYYFILTNIFHAFLALYFCFVREDTPYKAIKLTWNDDLIRDHLESPYFKKWDI